MDSQQQPGYPLQPRYNPQSQQGSLPQGYPEYPPQTQPGYPPNPQQSSPNPPPYTADDQKELSLTELNEKLTNLTLSVNELKSEIQSMRSSLMGSNGHNAQLILNELNLMKQKVADIHYHNTPQCTLL